MGDQTYKTNFCGMDAFWKKTISISLICCSPNVVFCGYSVPHPSENKINLRIQTNGKCGQY